MTQSPEPFYRFVLQSLNQSKISYLVGGTHAFAPYTGIDRDTKDLDIFIYRKDCQRIIQMFGQMGFRTELHFVHWIAKIYSETHLIDLIFSSGNGLCEVDELWFEHAVDGTTLGVPVKFCPAEEIIWQKAFIMEHLRYDGADIAHIIYARSEHFDWGRLLKRFGPFWRVLLIHLVLFGFIYPDVRNKIPIWVMETLLQNLRQELRDQPPQENICQGTLLSLLEYLQDIKSGDYKDARLKPSGHMSAEEIQQFTRAFITPL